MKIAKVRTTNYGTGAPVSGLDWLAASQIRDALEHDKCIEGYSEETLRAAARDLGKRLASNRKDPEQRWVMARKAAVLRKLTHTPTSR